MPLITCKDVAFAYDGNIVVHGLNFTVNQGDYLCIVGENGSGKTTLMQGLLGLMRPKSGEIELGEDLRHNQIGYMPQQNSSQKDFPASVYEVVLSGRLSSRGALPFYSKRDKEIALSNMEKLGILPMRNKSFRELSGGQQQRVLLSRALCATEKMLLLDEPVNGLDPVATLDLYRAINDLSRDTKITIIMISHDVRTAVEYASHILHLQNSRVYFGTSDLYKETAAGRRFLGGDIDGTNS
ncbi:MAG: ABC transporter ATP-binding protein [Defluviitaleaceae bacterium]|nr:ABC transporter ATP-binding protein [Defluviitaleaceae bacterium]